MSPIIGFTLDSEPAGGWSKMPWYALRQNYCASVASLGAVPVCLPHELGQIDDYLNLIDGLVVTGGAFDVPPALYGDATQHETVATKDARTAFEYAMLKGCIERKIPILGICGGQQLLNVVLGGTLIQHIPDHVENALAHEQPNPRTEPGHHVTVKENTLLHRIVGVAQFDVNSAHHQAVDGPAPGSVVSALAEDGVIEAIELPLSAHPFCLGVQWHPEYHVTGHDTKIFAAFVEACGKR